ncbi:recombination mediator RecR [Paracoccus aminophilus]|uniref:Recombination protein RecR n=1 Tax=Paracoccus aminophilus JCM 7686 TaxID=1367847 RepID=S5YC90_PARAH|nr:recombination mediator RecR [Paracoccus aminophilus]AGT09043.1 recombination protein RecR [Paracoccus aminophilus JCM 7686]
MSEDRGDIQALIAQIARLPGLGPRSARRIVLHLIRKRAGQMSQLASLMAEVAENSRECAICGNISDQTVCAICEDARRATGEICVVTDVADLWALERGRAFHGRYHVLGGSLSALDEIGPDDLRIPALIARISDEHVTEVILALAATVEGQTTAHYIAEALAPTGVTVTGLAQGVPIGGELDYLDDGTITAALRARRRL